jgi:hypothetical protein
VTAETEDESSVEFHPVEELRGTALATSRVAATELFVFALLSFVASMAFTLIDSYARRNVISGTLIVMLFVAAIGLAVTGRLAQRDTSVRSRRP